jgi:hypothetical protein
MADWILNAADGATAEGASTASCHVARSRDCTGRCVPAGRCAPASVPVACPRIGGAGILTRCFTTTVARVLHRAACRGARRTSGCRVRGVGTCYQRTPVIDQTRSEVLTACPGNGCHHPDDQSWGERPAPIRAATVARSAPRPSGPPCWRHSRTLAIRIEPSIVQRRPMLRLEELLSRWTATRCLRHQNRWFSSWQRRARA